jgi:hypothetical protein
MDFDEDEQIILQEIEKYFGEYYDFLGKEEALRLFGIFRQTLEAIKSTENRKALLNRKFVVLRRDLAEKRQTTGLIGRKRH